MLAAGHGGEEKEGEDHGEDAGVGGERGEQHEQRQEGAEGQAVLREEEVATAAAAVHAEGRRGVGQPARREGGQLVLAVGAGGQLPGGLCGGGGHETTRVLRRGRIIVCT